MSILGSIAAAFAFLLLVLPAVRVAQGRLAPPAAAGLWIAGAGFLLLALAAFVLDGDTALGATLAGVALAVTGNVVQRRVSRGPPPPQ